MADFGTGGADPSGFSARRIIESVFPAHREF
jgi:hypothetical protein